MRCCASWKDQEAGASAAEVAPRLLPSLPVPDSSCGCREVADLPYYEARFLGLAAAPRTLPPRRFLRDVVHHLPPVLTRLVLAYYQAGIGLGWNEVGGCCRGSSSSSSSSGSNSQPGTAVAAAAAAATATAPVGAGTVAAIADVTAKTLARADASGTGLAAATAVRTVATRTAGWALGDGRHDDDEEEEEEERDGHDDDEALRPHMLAAILGPWLQRVCWRRPAPSSSPSRSWSPSALPPPPHPSTMTLAPPPPPPAAAADATASAASAAASAPSSRVSVAGAAASLAPATASFPPALLSVDDREEGLPLPQPPPSSDDDGAERKQQLQQPGIPSVSSGNADKPQGTSRSLPDAAGRLLCGLIVDYLCGEHWAEERSEAEECAWQVQQIEQREKGEEEDEEEEEGRTAAAVRAESGKEKKQKEEPRDDWASSDDAPPLAPSPSPSPSPPRQSTGRGSPVWDEFLGVWEHECWVQPQEGDFQLRLLNYTFAITHDGFVMRPTIQRAGWAPVAASLSASSSPYSPLSHPAGTVFGSAHLCTGWFPTSAFRAVDDAARDAELDQAYGSTGRQKKQEDDRPRRAGQQPASQPPQQQAEQSEQKGVAGLSRRQQLLQQQQQHRLQGWQWQDGLLQQLHERSVAGGGGGGGDLTAYETILRANSERRTHVERQRKWYSLLLRPAHNCNALLPFQRLILARAPNSGATPKPTGTRASLAWFNADRDRQNAERRAPQLLAPDGTRFVRPKPRPVEEPDPWR